MTEELISTGLLQLKAAAQDCEAKWRDMRRTEEAAENEIEFYSSFYSAALVLLGPTITMSIGRITDARQDSPSQNPPPSPNQ